jgi:hypothetical protein
MGDGMNYSFKQTSSNDALNEPCYMENKKIKDRLTLT